MMDQATATSNEATTTTTMTAIKQQEQCDSIQLEDVFVGVGKELVVHDDETALGKEGTSSKDCCDGSATAGTASDSDHSLSLNGSGRRSSSGRGSILRVSTLEESLAHIDIERSNSTGTSSSSVEDDDDADDNNDAPAGPAEEDPQANDGNAAGVAAADTQLAAVTAAGAELEASHNKSVTFSEVQVREYPMCLGDNPSVMIGAPLTIAWEAQTEGKLSLEDYETSRPQRRRSEELRIPSFVREEILRNNGYSRLDIQRGVRDVNIARNRRKRTQETFRLHKAQEVAEKLVRGALNKTVRRSKKQQEKELIDHFRSSASALVEEKRQIGGKVRRNTWYAGATSVPPATTTAATTTTKSSSSSSSPPPQATTKTTTCNKPLQRRGTWHVSAAASSSVDSSNKTKHALQRISRGGSATSRRSMSFVLDASTSTATTIGSRGSSVDV